MRKVPNRERGWSGKRDRIGIGFYTEHRLNESALETDLFTFGSIYQSLCPLFMYKSNSSLDLI